MKNTEIEYLINLRADKRLCLIEYLIKQKDKSLDQSRAAILSRAIENVELGTTNWDVLYTKLQALKQPEGEDVPQFTSWQAKLNPKDKENYDKICKEMRQDLIEKGIIKRTLRAQLMVVLLLYRYLDALEREEVMAAQKIEKEKRADKIISELELPVAQMGAILIEMLLTDKDSPALKEINQIMVQWLCRTRQKSGQEV
ncbi:hypothetical protein [uncultured Ruminococcus sp.]|uniref:hypothetical protein n=1 Tax=uncultured Ruminococcus sp. TaxID=165186 RepID=UPI0025D243D2|nr:hypothetical protein [uncultured Ruminococcus sp.]